MPVARVKFKDGKVFSTPLYTYFALGEYANKAVFIASPMLGEALPMLLEIGNGTGTYELAIDRSSEVEHILAACGQDQASLAKAKAEQERAAQEASEESARKTLITDRDSLIAELGRSCRSVGDLTKFDISEHETVFNRLPPELKETVKLDCNESAPEQLQAFRVEFESEYVTHSTYLAGGGNSRKMPHCSAKDFLAYVHSIKGIENLRSHSDDCEEWKRFGSTTGPSVADLASAAADGNDSMADYQADYERSREAAIEDARNAISGASIAPEPKD